MAELADNGLNRKIADAASVAKEIDALEASIAELRQAYEQFFLGLERKPPTLQHNDLKKKIQRVRGAFVRQTAIKFRINALQQKFATYERLWSRTLMEIENGTYRRDVMKARLQKKKDEKKAEGPKVNELPSADEFASSLEEALSEAEVEISPPPPQRAAVAAAPGIAPVKPGAPAPAPRPGTPAAPVAAAAKGSPAAAATRPVGVPAVAPPGTQVRLTPTGSAPVSRPAASAGGTGGAGGNPPLSDAKLRAVYDAYVTAKKRCQEDTSKLNYEQVAANLRKQVPELMKKANANSVEFKIVIKDGKAVLRAIPK